MKNFSNRKGFTLVELLIVIVVIGVLSAMMMLSSTEAVSSANAASIVSNLRNLKTAILSWYADNLDKVKLENNRYKIIDASGTAQEVKAFVGSNASEFLKYLNNDSSVILKHEKVNTGEYLLAAVDNNKKWYICYNLSTAGNKNLKEKLASRASSAELLGNGAEDTAPKQNYTNEKFVCMLVLNLAD